MRYCVPWFKRFIVYSKTSREGAVEPTQRYSITSYIAVVEHVKITPLPTHNVLRFWIAINRMNNHVNYLCKMLVNSLHWSNHCVDGIRFKFSEIKDICFCIFGKVYSLFLADFVSVHLFRERVMVYFVMRSLLFVYLKGRYTFGNYSKQMLT